MNRFDIYELRRSVLQRRCVGRILSRRLHMITSLYLFSRSTEIILKVTQSLF